MSNGKCPDCGGEIPCECYAGCQDAPENLGIQTTPQTTEHADLMRLADAYANADKSPDAEPTFNRSNLSTAISALIKAKEDGAAKNSKHYALWKDWEAIAERREAKVTELQEELTAARNAVLSEGIRAGELQARLNAVGWQEPDELICPACNGSGEGMYEGTTCRACRGSGVARAE